MREMRPVNPPSHGPIGGTTCSQTPIVEIVWPSIVPASAT